MITIDSLDTVNFEELSVSFKEAFKDYGFQLTEEELKKMLRRRGYVPALSFGAFDNNKLVSFTLNGAGTHDNIPTIYDTGTATIPAYRNMGLAKNIFSYSLPILKKAGFKQYLLEVLQNNTKALALYKKIGFGISRQFNYFLQQTDTLKIIQNKNTGISIVKNVALDNKKEMASCCDFTPAWQNSFEAIERALPEFVTLEIYDNGMLSGYCIFEPASGDIAQLAVHPTHRRKGLGTLLLKKALHLCKHRTIKFINTETNCASVTQFLSANNIPLKGKQYEMRLRL